MSYILALNCGSSSLKYQVYDADALQMVLSGNVEKIGLADSFITQKYPDGHKDKKETPMQNHSEALNVVMFMIRGASIDLNDIVAVGHRVVHGGDKFTHSVEITDEVMKTIDELSPLVPLHNPVNLLGIVVAKQLLPNAKQVAVFDTAFNTTMPAECYRYAVPTAWYRDLGVRRYGFHGTSHLYVSKRATKLLGKPASECNLITLHIGSGASAVAIKNGNCYDTSLGMTAMAGLTMSTRSGDIDQGAILYVMKQLHLSPEEMEKNLNKQSGILALSECSFDHRDVENGLETDDNCRLALDVEVHNIKKYLGSFLAELGHTDAIVFTAGVGENDDIVRDRVCRGLEGLGIKMDFEKNVNTHAYAGCGEVELSTPDSPIKIYMIPTNEELVIVEDTIAVANGTYNPDHLKMQYSFA